jgi:hypothetical protein
MVPSDQTHTPIYPPLRCTIYKKSWQQILNHDVAFLCQKETKDLRFTLKERRNFYLFSLLMTTVLRNASVAFDSHTSNDVICLKRLKYQPPGLCKFAVTYKILIIPPTAKFWIRAWLPLIRYYTNLAINQAAVKYGL